MKVWLVGGMFDGEQHELADDMYQFLVPVSLSLHNTDWYNDLESPPRRTSMLVAVYQRVPNTVPAVFEFERYQ